MSPNQNEEIDWNKVMEKEAMGESGLDLGTIKQVEDDYIVSEMGGLTKKEYKFPKSLAKSFNGVFLNFSVNETDLSTYEIGSSPSNFYTDPIEFPEAVPKEEEVLVPLVAEDLNVAKKIAQDNVKLVKEPIKETKTIQVKLMREKITIERREVSNSHTSFDTKAESGATYSASNSNARDHKDPDYSKTEISIPIKREEPVITKRSFVREEVVVSKKPVTETKEITEQVTSESQH